MTSKWKHSFSVSSGTLGAEGVLIGDPPTPCFPDHIPSGALYGPEILNQGTGQSMLTTQVQAEWSWGNLSRFGFWIHWNLRTLGEKQKSLRPLQATKISLPASSINPGKLHEVLSKHPSSIWEERAGIRQEAKCERQPIANIWPLGWHFVQMASVSGNRLSVPPLPHFVKTWRWPHHKAQICSTRSVILGTGWESCWDTDGSHKIL